MKVKVTRVVDGRIYTRTVGRRGWLVFDEVVRFLRVSRRTVFHLISRGVLHPQRVKRRLRFPVGELFKVRDQRGGRRRDAKTQARGGGGGPRRR